MAIAVAQVGGNVTSSSGGAGISFTFGSATTTGSAVALVGHCYNTSGAEAAGDFTDNKSNTQQLAGSLLGGAASIGIAGAYNNAGTRGSSHQYSYNAPGNNDSANLAGIEFTGQDASTSTSCFDSASFATANDATSAWSVTAAAAVPSGALAVYGVSIDTGTNDAFTQPTGYTNIINQPDGTSFLVSCASYKLSESGTPTVGATSGHTAGSGSARELFMAFIPAAGGAAAGEAGFLFMPDRFDDVLPGEIRPYEVQTDVYWFDPGSAVAAPVDNPITITVTQTQSPVITKTVGLPRTVTSTQTASIVKQVAKTIAVTSTQTASVVKNIAKAAIALTQTQTVAVLINKAFGVTISVTQTQTASITKNVGKPLAVTSTQTASVVKNVGKNITKTQTQTPSIVKNVAITRSVTETQTVTATIGRAFVKVITVTQTQTASIAKSVGKAITVTSTQTPTIRKAVAFTRSVTQTQVASVAKNIAKSFVAFVTQTASALIAHVIGGPDVKYAFVSVEVLGAARMSIEVLATEEAGVSPADTGSATMTTVPLGNATMSVEPLGSAEEDWS